MVALTNLHFVTKLCVPLWLKILFLPPPGLFNHHFNINQSLQEEWYHILQPLTGV